MSGFLKKSNADYRKIVAQRLRAKRGAAGLSSKQVADAIGAGKTSVTNWELEISAPKQPEAEALGHLYGVHPAYFMGLEVPTESYVEPSPYLAQNRLAQNNLAQNDTAIPTPEYSDSVAFRADFFEQQQLDPKQTTSTKAIDDAMSGEINKGDNVLLDTRVNKVTVRDIYALLVADQLWLRWAEMNLDGSVTIRAEHSGYSEQTVQPDQITVIGRICTVIRAR